MRKISLKEYLKSNQIKQNIEKEHQNKIKIAFLIIIAYIIFILKYIFGREEKTEKLAVNIKSQKITIKKISTREFLDYVEESQKNRNLNVDEINTLEKISKIIQKEIVNNSLKNKEEDAFLIGEIEQYNESLDRISLILKKESTNIVIDKTDKNNSKNNDIGISDVEIENNAIEIEFSPQTKDLKLLIPTAVNNLTEENQTISNNYQEEIVTFEIEKELKNDVKEIKGNIKKIAEIEEKIPSTTIYNDFYEYEYQLKKIHQYLKKIEKKYHDFGNNKEYTLIIDKLKKIEKNRIVLDDKQLKLQINKCEKLLLVIENNKKEIYYKKEKKEEKKIEQDELKEETKELTNNSEPKKSIDLIQTELIKQKKDLIRVQDEIKQTPEINKKHSILKFITNWSKNFFTFGISLLPAALFKNKTLGIFTSLILLNHSLKVSNKMLDPNYSMNDEYYNNILNNIENNEITLFDIKYSCLDSLTEIYFLKDQLESKYDKNSPEVSLVLKRLDMLEESLNSRIDYVDEISLENSQKKAKIKQLEKKYN